MASKRSAVIDEYAKLGELLSQFRADLSMKVREIMVQYDALDVLLQQEPMAPAVVEVARDAPEKPKRGVVAEKEVPTRKSPARPVKAGAASGKEAHADFDEEDGAQNPLPSRGPVRKGLVGPGGIPAPGPGGVPRWTQSLAAEEADPVDFDEDEGDTRDEDEEEEDWEAGWPKD